MGCHRPDASEQAAWRSPRCGLISDRFTDFSPVAKLPEEIYSSEILAILNKLEQVRRAMPNRTSAAPALDHIHCRAICDEIGERLRDILGSVGNPAAPTYAD